MKRACQENQQQEPLTASQNCRQAEHDLKPLAANHLQNYARLLIGALCTAFLAGCGSQTAENASGPPTFTNVYATSFAGCKSCHAPGQPTWDMNGVHLDFTTQATAYSTLRSWRVAGAGSGGNCSGILTVSPGNPGASYVEAMVDPAYRTSPFPGGTGGGCVPYDHSGFVNLSATSKAALTTWIQNGANND